MIVFQERLLYNRYDKHPALPPPHSRHSVRQLEEALATKSPDTVSRWKSREQSNRVGEIDPNPKKCQPKKHNNDIF